MVKGIDMFEIKRAQRSDADTAFDIRRQSIRQLCRDAYSEAQLSTWTQGSAADGYDALMDGHFYLGYLDGAAVATGMFDPASGEVGAIFVLPHLAQQGLGRAMLDFLENLARELGVLNLNLDATLNAAPFYRRCGYSGDTPAHYQSPTGITLACIPMLKTL